MLVSVIIPTKDRSDRLARLLGTLVRQQVDQIQFEVVVVHDALASPESRCAIHRWGGSGISIISSPAPGLHAGRHAGMAKARGDILIFADDDILPGQAWVASICEAFADPGIAMVGGNNLPIFEAVAPEWLTTMWNRRSKSGHRMIPSLSVLEIASAEVMDHEPFLVWGCNFAIRRDVLLRAGGFHPDGMPEELLRFRGDGETYVSSYVKRSGLRCVFHPGALVYHAVPAARMTPAYFERRGYKQGISDSYTRLRKRHLNESGGYFSRLAASGLEHVNRYVRRYRDGASARSSGHNEIQAVETLMASGWRAGYDFHQQAFATDPEVREWVLRPDYIGVTL